MFVLYFEKFESTTEDISTEYRYYISRDFVRGVSLRVDGLVCCAPPYLEAKCCRGL